MTAMRILGKAIGVLIDWEILLYGTIAKVWIKILDVTLTVTGKIIGAVQKVVGFLRTLGGAARTAGNVVATGFHIMINPILTVISYVQRLIDLIRSIPVVGSIGSGSGSDFYSGGHAARAMGGPVGRGRPYVVGERGPELFVPRASGRIVPNGAMAGAGGSVQVIVLGGDRNAIEWLRGLDVRQARRSGRGLL
jgi:hypothetical protein